MAKRYTQVPISYLTPIFEEWRSTYDKGDLVNVFFMPKGDILFRALQFVDWVSDKYSEVVRVVNFESELILNPENLREVLTKYKQDKLLLLAKREFLQPDGSLMAAVLEEFYAKEGKGILIFHEGYPLELEKYTSNPVMNQKNIVHKIYSKDVIIDYISCTAKLFNVSVDQNLAVRIANYCGGIPWLVNDVLRRIDDPMLFDNEVFNWKVKQIAQSIPSVVGIEKDLREFGLQDSEGNWIPVLHDYYEREAKTALIIEADEIVWRGRELSSLFSAGERRIMGALYEKDEIVSREEVGKLFWQEANDVEYSDWALDAIMSRLRKKLKKIGLPIAIITKRGHGYGIR